MQGGLNEYVIANILILVQTLNTNSLSKVHCLVMSTNVPPNEMFKLTLRRRHLEQLRHVDIPAERIPGPPWPTLPGAPSPYDQLVDWSKQASAQIAKAVASRELTCYPP